MSVRNPLPVRSGPRRLATVLIIGATAIASVAASASVASAASGQSVPVSPPSSAGTITVVGQGSVTVTPDIVLLSVGVETTGSTGAEVMNQLDDRSNALTEALIASGIAPADLQTTSLNLFNTFDRDGITVDGYTASVQIAATLRDVDSVGTTIDAAQQAVGDGLTLGGVQFSFADPETVLEQARVDAIADARTKAQQYAAAAGVALGDVLAIVEAGASTPPLLRTTAQADMAASGPAISTGSLDLTATVSVTYAIG